MNPGDIAVVVIVAGAVAYLAWRQFAKKKGGGCGCSAGSPCKTTAKKKPGS